MAYKFNECKSLANIYSSNINTKNVTDMSNIFYGCNSLTNFDLSNFNTQNFIDMANMFDGCNSLINIDLSVLGTPNVLKWIVYVIYYSLTNIDLSYFNIQNVKNMTCMFECCISLTKINLFKFNTKKL